MLCVPVRTGGRGVESFLESRAFSAVSTSMAICSATGEGEMEGAKEWSTHTYACER